MIKIDKNIEAPDRAKWVKILKLMKKGDSILLDGYNEAMTFRVTARRLNLKITQRKVENGIRVWIV